MALRTGHEDSKKRCMGASSNFRTCNIRNIPRETHRKANDTELGSMLVFSVYFLFILWSFTLSILERMVIFLSLSLPTFKDHLPVLRKRNLL